jgi:transposase
MSDVAMLGIDPGKTSCSVADLDAAGLVVLRRRVARATPKRQGGDRRSGRNEAHAGLILGAIERQPDITFADVRTELARHGVAISVAGLWRFFPRRRITLKKSGHAAEQDRPEVLKRRWE